MTQTAFIVGGAGQIGRAMATSFIDAGWSVRCGQRDPATLPEELRKRGVTAQALDRDDDDALREAIAPGFDAVIDTVAFTPAHGRQWCALADKIGALAVISSGSVYCDAEGRTLDEAQADGFPHFPIPIAENQSRTPPGDETYSTRKVALEDVLLGELGIPLTILRPLAVYGPGSRSPREWWFLARALAGAAEIPLAYDGQSRFHTSAAANIAELCKVAILHGGTHVLNAADNACLSVAEIGQAILDAIGSPARIVPFAGPPQGLVGRSPWTIERPMIADMRAAAAIGYRAVTDYRSGIADTCAALLRAAEASDWRSAFPGLGVYPAAMFEGL